MTTIEIEKNFSAVFNHGETLAREVRLTDEEAAYVRANYAAVLTDMGEHWYQLLFKRGPLS